MQEKLTELVEEVIKRLYSVSIEVELTRPEEQFGDYATNVAMKLAKETGKNPREVAEETAKNLKSELVASATVAGPGFINIKLTDKALLKQATAEPVKNLKDQVVVTEYSDPNPFKVLHAGHLYTSVVGDSIANMLENAGAKVHRVNFGGDVGLHVGKTMWAILRELGGEEPEKLKNLPESERSEFMAKAYVAGTAAYDEDGDSKEEIRKLNKLIYDIVAKNEKSSKLAQIYWTCRKWSYDYFDQFYERIGTKFEKYYPESEVAELGLKKVRQQLKNGVFKESDGAVVFEGEGHGLHTRVFINSEGLPTYETKDVGLIFTKWQDFHFDKSVVITGNEQEQYMTVVLKAVEQFAPELVKATSHLTHGIVKLQGGVKMSSRKGNILRAVDVLDAAAEANQKLTSKDDELVVLGAVKYAFLKQRTGGDIIYDPKESVSLEGNSGPYLQYAHARARSILTKALSGGKEPKDLVDGERSLAKKLGEFPEVIVRATAELMPHYICTYLYELSQTFNRFYENSRVIGDQREDGRLWLVDRYADVLKSGLELLGITAPESM